MHAPRGLRRMMVGIGPVLVLLAVTLLLMGDLLAGLTLGLATLGLVALWTA